MNIFDVIGPVMVGPSSSHTAGAARLGCSARRLLGASVKRAEITLFESFAATGKGHGTDKAVVGGLLGMTPDDARLPSSFDLARAAGLAFHITCSDERRGHPNTAELRLFGDNAEICVTGVSIGGGRIEITKINGFDVSMRAEKHTLVVFSVDKSGTIAHIARILTEAGVNIATMHVSRKDEGRGVVMVITTDQQIPRGLTDAMKVPESVCEVIYFAPF